MTVCKRCKKALRNGDEAHIVDNEVFCSAECAIINTTDEIIMNAKEMAKEQYNDTVTIATIRTSADYAMCAACDQDLAKCDTIFAAEGILYCSRDCGIHDFSVRYLDAEERFDAVAEEISPKEIGL